MPKVEVKQVERVVEAGFPLMPELGTGVTGLLQTVPLFLGSQHRVRGPSCRSSRGSDPLPTPLSVSSEPSGPRVHARLSLQSSSPFKIAPGLEIARQDQDSHGSRDSRNVGFVLELLSHKVRSRVHRSTDDGVGRLLSDTSLSRLFVLWFLEVDAC